MDKRSEGTWGPKDLRRAFVEGAAWWEFHSRGATMWQSDRRIVEDEAQNRYGSQHGAGMEGMNQIPQGEYCGDCPCKNEGFSGLYCGYFRKFVRYVSLKDKYQRLPECLKRRPFIKDQGE